MRIRTLIFLFMGLFASGWLCWVFVMLFINGSMIIPEPNRIISGIEIALTLLAVALGIERLINLREKR
jgi:hypothetical protein